MKIEIHPLVKVVIDDFDLCFGMERSDVEIAVGKGEPAGNRCYYFDNEMAIDYSDNKVEFIEFLGGSLRPLIYGVSVFETKADDLFEVLKKENKDGIVDGENGYSYQFQNISIGIYREAVPAEVEEMIKEAAGFGNPMSEDEIRYEMERADYWATVGAGIDGYYRK